MNEAMKRILLLLLTCIFTSFAFAQKEVDIYELKQLANAGDADAQWYLGWHYLAGEGVEKNEKIAFNLFMKSAQQGNEDGEYYVGQCYFEGIVVEQDATIAYDWFRKSAEKGHDMSLFMLGVCYENGIGTDRDDKQAFRHYWDSANKGYVLAQYRMGTIYLRGELGVEQNTEFAYEWLLKAAEQGFRDASFLVGYIHYDNHEYNKAFYWFSDAAEQDSKQGLFYLGRCYESGLGVLASDEAAFACYKKSAELGFPLAKSQLAYCYLTGTGTEKNDEEGYKWAVEAAEEEWLVDFVRNHFDRNSKEKKLLRKYEREIPEFKILDSDVYPFPLQNFNNYKVTIRPKTLFSGYKPYESASIIGAITLAICVLAGFIYSAVKQNKS